MGKCRNRCNRLCVYKCVTFNISTGAGGVMIQTDLYVTKNKNTITLQWCTFGGQTSTNQTSTTAQNQKIPCDFLPICDQNFVISGINADTGQAEPMKLIISSCGDITFVFSVSGVASPSFVTFEGGSVTWVAFNCCTGC